MPPPPGSNSPTKGATSGPPNPAAATANELAQGAPTTADSEPPVPAFYARRRKRANEICQILIRSGDVKPEHVRQGLKIQEERGGQIGRILVQMGACTERSLARALTKQVQRATKHSSSQKFHVPPDLNSRSAAHDHRSAAHET